MLPISKTGELTDDLVVVIFQLKKIRCTPNQISKITGIGERKVEKILNSKLREIKKSKKYFDHADY